MKIVGSARMAALAGFALLAQSALVSGAAAQAIIEGVWQTQDKSEITIAPCDAGLCGSITKIVVPPDIAAQYSKELQEIGSNILDYNNKDAALRNRPILNLEILRLRPGNNPWVFDGEVYNPQDGNTYSGYVQVIDPDRIKLNGCVLYNLICQGQEWTRLVVPPTVEAVATPAGAPPQPAPMAAQAAVPAQAPVPAEASLRPR